MFSFSILQVSHYISKLLPLNEENHVLAYQACCLVINVWWPSVFDLQMHSVLMLLMPVFVNPRACN
jgi:THO complex subunit 5